MNIVAVFTILIVTGILLQCLLNYITKRKIINIMNETGVELLSISWDQLYKRWCRAGVTTYSFTFMLRETKHTGHLTLWLIGREWIIDAKEIIDPVMYLQANQK